MKYSFQTLFLAVWPVLQRVGFHKPGFMGHQNGNHFSLLGQFSNFPDICVWLSVDVYCRSAYY